MTAPIRNPFPTPPAKGEAVTVAEGVLWLRLPLPMALDHVNVYALDDGDGWTLIDTGLSTALTRALWGDIMAGPLGGRPINRVLVTHHHPDHIGLAGWFREVHGARILTTRTAYLYARMLQLDVQERPVPETVTFWKRCGMAPEVLEQRLQERPLNFADALWPLPLGFERIQQGDVLTLGQRRWAVHVGAGHAPEHATLWSLDDNLVISGDQVISSISPNLGTHATEPEGDPVSDWIEACTRLSALARPDHLVLCGHKLVFTGLPARLRQLIENHHSALERLHRHLATPAAAGDCFAPLYRREIRPGEYGLALVEAMSHCNHLWHQGRATRALRADGAWVFTAC